VTIISWQLGVGRKRGGGLEEAILEVRMKEVKMTGGVLEIRAWGENEGDEDGGRRGGVLGANDGTID
jgi:hypothetical protein